VGPVRLTGCDLCASGRMISSSTGVVFLTTDLGIQLSTTRLVTNDFSLSFSSSVIFSNLASLAPQLPKHSGPIPIKIDPGCVNVRPQAAQRPEGSIAPCP